METSNVRTKWNIDKAHSEILFKVKHLMITNVKGEFRDFTVEAESDDDEFHNVDVNVVIKAASLLTNSNDRDAHLRSADFFDVEKYPELTFKSISFKKINDEKYTLVGLLTIKGISNEVTLDVEYGGTSVDPWGNKKVGFSVNGSFNRKDWGLNWNATLETGGVLVADEVKVNAEVQFVKV